MIDHAGRGPWAWIGVASGLAVLALIGWFSPRESIDWQPAWVTTEPWRALSAVGVHYSLRHLAGNLAGAAVVGAFGAVARVPARLALAWLVTWPLTQLGLLLRPELQHYGGLSGVLHAGVAIVTLWLLVNATGWPQRALALAVALGLAIKVIGEAPWGPVLRTTPNWDIAVAPLAHATGVVAGLLCAGLALALWRAPRQPRMRPTSAEVE